LNGNEKGATCVAPRAPWPPPLLLAVTQRPDVCRDLVHLVVVDVGAAPGWHRDAALRLLLGHALLDVRHDARVGPIAVEPLVVDQVGRRSEHPLRVLTVAGVTVPGAGENGLTLVDLILGDSARQPLGARRYGGGEKTNGDEQTKTSTHV